MSEQALTVMPSPQIQRQGAFDSMATFELATKAAACLASSSMVPVRYQGQENEGNCVIAVDLAFRIGLPPLMVMQNLYVVYGTPSWSGQMCLALINSSGQFKEPIRFEFRGETGQDAWGCRALGVRPDGKVVDGPWVDIAMAKAEGWFDRKDKEGRLCSKWRTIPDLMLRYRAATYFGRTVCPERLMGLSTREEMEDMGPGETITLAPSGPTFAIDKTTGPAAIAAPAPDAPAPATNPTPASPRRQRKPAEPAPDLAPGAAPAAAPATVTAPEPAAQAETTPAPAAPAPAAVTAPAPAEPPMPTARARTRAAAAAPAPAPAAPVEVQRTHEQWVDMLSEVLGTHEVTIDDFLSYIHSTGWDRKFENAQKEKVDASKLESLDDMPTVMVKAAISDEEMMVKCVKIYAPKKA